MSALSLGGRGPLARLLSATRTQMAVKCALAAALSWVCAEAVTQVVGNGLDDYMYYAPLGAVVATWPTIADAAQTAWQAAWALALGAGLGLAVHYALPESPLSLALVVGAGVALGALPGLGEQRSWVPIVALFVLVIGASHPLSYAAAYVGLTSVGALCGVLVNVLLPALPLRRGHEAVARLRHLLSGQLREVAEGLREHTPPTPQTWRQRRREIDTVVATTRDAVRDLDKARRGNPRGHLHRADIRRQDQLESVLERVALLVADLWEILLWTHRDDLPTSPLDAGLAEAVAEALDRLAALVDAYDVDLTAEDDRVRDVELAMEQLTSEFGRRRDLDADDIALLGAVVANLRWSTSALWPE